MVSAKAKVPARAARLRRVRRVAFEELIPVDLGTKGRDETRFSMLGGNTHGAHTIRTFSNDFAFTEEKCSKSLAAMFCCIPGKIESPALPKEGQVQTRIRTIQAKTSLQTSAPASLQRPSHP